LFPRGNDTSATSQSTSYETTPSVPSPSTPVTPPSQSRGVIPRTPPSDRDAWRGWNSDSSSDDERKGPARTPMVFRYHDAGRLDVALTERLLAIRATPLAHHQTPALHAQTLHHLRRLGICIRVARAFALLMEIINTKSTIVVTIRILRPNYSFRLHLLNNRHTVCCKNKQCVTATDFQAVGSEEHEHNPNPSRLAGRAPM